VLPDVGHACTVHGARTYVPGGFLKARSHASIRERDLHLHACICVVVVPDPRAACLLGCKRARAGEQMAGLCVCRPGYAHMHRISGPGGAGRPCQARSASACKCSKDDEAGSAMCRALAATGCCIGHVAPACRRGPSLPGCWLCLPLPCRRARPAAGLSIRLSNSAYNGLPYSIYSVHRPAARSPHTRTDQARPAGIPVAA
jgi:hypothetical protein